MSEFKIGASARAARATTAAAGVRFGPAAPFSRAWDPSFRPITDDATAPYTGELGLGIFPKEDMPDPPGRLTVEEAAELLDRKVMSALARTDPREPPGLEDAIRAGTVYPPRPGSASWRTELDRALRDHGLAADLEVGGDAWYDAVNAILAEAGHAVPAAVEAGAAAWVEHVQEALTELDIPLGVVRFRLGSASWYEQVTTKLQNNEPAAWIPLPVSEQLMKGMKGIASYRAFVESLIMGLRDINMFIHRLDADGATEAQIRQLVTELMLPQTVGLFGDDHYLDEFEEEELIREGVKDQWGAYYNAVMYNRRQVRDEKGWFRGPFAPQVARGLVYSAFERLYEIAERLDLEPFPDKDKYKDDLAIAVLEATKELEGDIFYWSAQDKQRWNAYVDLLRDRAIEDRDAVLEALWDRYDAHPIVEPPPPDNDADETDGDAGTGLDDELIDEDTRRIDDR